MGKLFDLIVAVLLVVWAIRGISLWRRVAALDAAAFSDVPPEAFRAWRRLRLASVGAIVTGCASFVWLFVAESVLGLYRAVLGRDATEVVGALHVLTLFAGIVAGGVLSLLAHRAKQRAAIDTTL